MSIFLMYLVFYLLVYMCVFVSHFLYFPREMVALHPPHVNMLNISEAFSDEELSESFVEEEYYKVLGKWFLFYVYYYCVYICYC